MKIGFDLDGVLIPSVKYVESLASTKFGREFIHTDYYADNMPGVSLDEVKYIQQLFMPNVIGKIAATIDTILLYHQLQQDHDVFILTSRQPTDQGLFYTYSQCLKYFDTEPIMCGQVPKWTLLRRMRPDYYVEDCYENAVQIMRNTHIPCFLLNTPYNTGSTKPYYEPLRIDSLQELLPLIEQHIEWRPEYDGSW